MISKIFTPRIVAGSAGLALLTILLLLPFSSAWAGKRVNLDITSAEFKKIPVAVPYFVDSNRPNEIQQAGQELAMLASKALDFHGFIKTISPTSYGGRQDADWANVGADFVVTVQYAGSADNVVMEMRLTDVLEGKMILGLKYTFPWNKRKQMVLKFCDAIIEKLTGIPGVCDTKIAFVSDKTGQKEIFLVDIFGDSVRQVTRHKFLAVSPRFSPDNKKLAYTSYHRGNANLYITELSQDKTTQAFSRRSGLNMAPAWTPNGDSLVVTLSKDGNPDLYQLSTDGSVVRRLTTNAGLNVAPCFSPDGSKLAFVSDRTGEPQVYIMDYKSGTVNRITYQGNENTTPAWSPDGKWIAYTGKDDGRYQLFKISPEGGQPVQLTSSAGDHEAPSWSPDSRLIVFSRAVNSQKKLYVISQNGKDMRQLYSFEGNQTTPQWSNRMN
ncbi:MAG: Tol-Pal system beta propeller repeat protein TolB [Deltaproteobacteria bacterium]|nr:Tol-Pal system beta propeller repeat protein TolB [Deltaproteobacteria bacterium]